MCVKPAGIPSEGPGGMTERLERQLGGRIFPVHRLDQAAAGLMVFATTAPAAAALSRAVREGRMEKEYFALVSGVPAEKAGRMADLLFHDARSNRVFPVRSRRKGVREAALTYQTVESRDGVTLVRVTLETGRTHQIRVQFASRGMPLLGDGKYGSRSKGPLALWSCRLAFPRPDGKGTEQVFLPPEGEAWARFQWQEEQG